MGRNEARSQRVDPREPVWLSVATTLVCLGEGALIIYVLFELRPEVFALTAWLAELTTATASSASARWPLPWLAGIGGRPPFEVADAWLVAIVATAVFVMFGLVILARKGTRALLEATYTSSAPFRRRRSATLGRLDSMLS